MRASPPSASSRASSASILHIGSLAIKLSPEKAANRSFLIDRKGEIIARYDKIHMFDVDLAGGESYRESRSYRPGEIARRRRPALGPARLDHLLRSALPRALPRAGGGRQPVSRHPFRLHATDRRGALARAQPRARHRERRVRLRGGARRQARERPRDLRPFAHGRSLGPHHRRRGHRAGRRAGEIDPAEVAAARAKIPSLQHGRRFRWSSRWRTARTCTRCGGSA